MRLSVLLLAVAGAAACGPPDAQSDAGTHADGGPTDGALVVPIAPTPPAPPAFACPTGWAAADAHGATICEPWRGERAPHCADGELASVGGAADCVSFSACAEGEWPDVPGGDAVYARAGAVGGDGTAALPFGTLAEALSLARVAHRPIALGEGELVESVQISGVPAVFGLCPSRTRIRQPSADDAAIVILSGEIELRGLALSGGRHGLWLNRDAHATLFDVQIEGASGGLRVERNAVLVGDRVRIAGPTSAGTTRSAVHVMPNATVTLARSLLTGGLAGQAAIRGWLVDGGPSTASVVLEDSAILDVPYAALGHVDVIARRVAIERSGVLQTSAGRHVELTDVRVRDVVGPSGFLTAMGSTATLTRVAVTGLEGTAMTASFTVSIDPIQAPGTITGQDLVITEAGATGSAVFARSGSTVDLTRVEVGDVAGAFVSLEGQMTLRDVVIRELRGIPRDGADAFGSGLSAQGGSLLVERASITAATPEVLPVLIGDGTDASLGDLDVEGGQGIRVTCLEGDGLDRHDPLACPDGLPIRLARVRLRSTFAYGLLADGAVSVSVDDLEVGSVTALESTRFAATGLFAAYSSQVVAQRVLVRAVEGHGVLAALDASVEIDGLHVLETRYVHPCTDCPMYYGDGLVCAEGGALTLTAFEVERSERAGIALAARCGPSRFENGTVHENAIGALTDGASSASATFVSVVLVDNDVPSMSVSFALAASDFGL